MKTFRYRPPDLENRRDNRVVLHVFRNLLTLHVCVHKLFFDGLTLDASRKVLTRLTDRGILNMYPLYGTTKYWRLGPRALTRWGYPRTRADKLGAQKLPYDLGALAYTCFGETPKKRLLEHQLLARLPWWPRSRMQWAYIWDDGRLGMIRVEPRCRPDRLVRKLGEQVFRYAEQPEFSQLVDEKRFYFVVVSASEYQELAVQHEASEQNLPVEIRTSHYLELVRFI